MQEYFSESGRVPEVEGVLYMKEGLKKPWKKYFFMLRASGLYHSTKGKSKVSWKSLVKGACVCMYVIASEPYNRTGEKYSVPGCIQIASMNHYLRQQY